MPSLYHLNFLPFHFIYSLSVPSCHCKADSCQTINKSHTCWKCSATNITTTDHLRPLSQKDKGGLRKPAINPAINPAISTAISTAKGSAITEPKSVKEEEEKIIPATSSPLDLSSLLQKDSAGGHSIAVSSNLQKTGFKSPVTKLDILQDGSFICLTNQKLVRYSHGGQIMAEFEPQIPPRNFLVRHNGEEIVVIDKEGIKVYDEKFLLLRQVSVSTQINLAQCEGLAEDGEGNLATINFGNGITDKDSFNIFIIDVDNGLLNRIIELKPLYEAVAQIEGTSPNKSRCKFIAVKNGVFYVVGLYF